MRRIRGGGQIDLVPSRLDLALSALNPGEKESVLEDFISQVEPDYDLVIIDCPPTESLFTRAAYRASDYMLIPVNLQYLSSIGLPLIARSIQLFLGAHRNYTIDVAGVVIVATANYMPEERLARQEVTQEVANQNWYLFSNEIAYSRSYPRGAREGKPIFRTPNANWHRQANFKNFGDEFAVRVGI